MVRVAVMTHVEAPPDRVWERLVDWESQPAWMVDARAVEVVSAQREGEGTRLACRTAIAFGLEVDDTLVVTGWQPGVSLAVGHEGRVIRGVGAFELTPTDHGTLVEWWEEFATPAGAAGEAVATVVVVPYVRRVFRRSLARFKRLAEAPGATS